MDDDGRFYINLDKWDQDEHKQIPSDLIEVIDETKFDASIEGESEVELLKSGLCVCCHRPFGKDTVILQNGLGIQSIACSGVCHDDMMVLAFLNEAAQDLIDRINMRRDATPGGHD